MQLLSLEASQAANFGESSLRQLECHQHHVTGHLHAEILCQSGLPPRKQLEPRQGHGKHETTSTENKQKTKTPTGKWEYVDIFAKQGLLNPHFAIHTLPISACCRNLHRTAPKTPPAHKGWLAAQSRFLTDIGCQSAVDLVSYHILAGWTWYLSRNKTELSNRSSRSSSRPWQDSKASNRAAAAIFSRSAPMYEAEPRSRATSSFSLRVPGTLPAVEENMVKLWHNHRESLLKPRLKSSSKIKIHWHDEEVIVQDWRQRRKRPVDLYMDENCNQNHQKIPSTLLKLDSKLLCEEFPKRSEASHPRLVPTESVGKGTIHKFRKISWPTPNIPFICVFPWKILWKMDDSGVPPSLALSFIDSMRCTWGQPAGRLLAMARPCWFHYWKGYKPALMDEGMMKGWWRDDEGMMNGW